MSHPAFNELVRYCSRCSSFSVPQFTSFLIFLINSFSCILNFLLDLFPAFFCSLFSCFQEHLPSVEMKWIKFFRSSFTILFESCNMLYEWQTLQVRCKNIPKNRKVGSCQKSVYLIRLNSGIVTMSYAIHRRNCRTPENFRNLNRLPDAEESGSSFESVS
eukprot:g43246.t1